MEKPKQNKLPSPAERLELILLGLARRVPVEELCRQAGVSRELFYRWLGRVRKAGLAALEAKAPGPKAIPPEKAEEEAQKLRARVAELEKANRELIRELEKQKLIAETGRRIIRRNAWQETEAAPACKKNGKRGRQAGSDTWKSGESPEKGTLAPGRSPKPGEYPGPRTGAG